MRYNAIAFCVHSARNFSLELIYLLKTNFATNYLIELNSKILENSTIEENIEVDNDKNAVNSKQTQTKIKI